MTRRVIVATIHALLASGFMLVCASIGQFAALSL
jgi:hypothetical protein